VRSHQAKAVQVNSTFSSRAGLLCLVLAVALAPLLFGSVTTEAQGVLGILLGLSLWFSSRDWRQTLPLIPRWLLVVFLTGIILSLMPLPLAVLKVLSPARADLAIRFPLQPDSAAWSTVTLSPALTLRWLWQLVLLLVVFALTRQQMRRSPAVVWVVLALGLGIIGQVAAEVYFQGAADRMVLGLWPVHWGNSGGTFANRNHFAGWLVMAALVLAALSIRYYRPLRTSRTEGQPVPSSRPALAWLLIGLTGLALVFALLSGSRSGLLALLAGGLMLVLGLKQHSTSRRRGFVLLTLALLLALGALPFAGRTLDRLSKTKDETSSSYAKWRLWEDAVRTFAKFPLMGTGPGTFVRSNILFKSAGGESTAWHAENDFLQWLSEAGLWGMVVLVGCGVAFWRKAVRWFWSPGWKTTEPELALGAFAGLIAIMTHSLFDFPWQVMANALLGALLLGVVVGLRDASTPAAEFKLASRKRGWSLAIGGLLLVVLAVLPILGFREYRLAQEKDLPTDQTVVHAARALSLCPVNVERANLWLRLQVFRLRENKNAAAAAGDIRVSYTSYLRTDPLNWELRLERAWLDIAFMKDRQKALQEAVAVTGLNPKQAMIPLRFASLLADRDPEKAWDFLLAADVTQEQLLRERLALGWQLRPDATQLWSLIPATENGYAALADFAFTKNLPVLALKAYERMRLPPPALARSGKFLLAQRPDLALRSLPEIPGNNQERLALAKVHLQLGDAPRCLRLLEPLFSQAGGPADWQRATRLDSSSEVVLRVWKSGDHSMRLALQVAEVLMMEAPNQRDMALLQQLSGSYPEEKRLLWLNYRTRLDRFDYREAAVWAVKLAEKLVPAK
jgi:hypothetical protein